MTLPAFLLVGLAALPLVMLLGDVRVLATLVLGWYAGQMWSRRPRW